ncbi:hypothetical protein I7I50_12601 [Histoplasma capsulatum G186AR]|uniref:Uncharacterized protein n=1 Tax=Ajellomyces capsulatus TaxID=5037 RepID=A0A8H7Y7Y0_AJECA|nr:hypothetical protein I7I52_11094 [Histoplasma capsulatum]QSS70839.1 hypothetical protein I7I50_12601 [Histoplasma capsulatum G186AR]
MCIVNVRQSLLKQESERPIAPFFIFIFISFLHSFLLLHLLSVLILELIPLCWQTLATLAGIRKFHCHRRSHGAFPGNRGSARMISVMSWLLF